ncbi:hypothetical protein LTR48_007441 [Friedmanniomyces endolithicus]|uniref:Uncharacterized protein n=1 Tax=Rachicladosporium monterosium TaxID=1507873 RepID=A0ABR0KWD3_9PEZI|nr:hypothetical protein LTS09_003128 [Friedmanniomyces endolithicus]KAK5139613.1 hypothetical protein LTR32_007331 [Rachicladosporium monterosium]KAK0792390.1 hypothetical protein LTR59_008593 [Friedmanniomyces endolithicus]KAK0815738.1 hypothetical protein LTR38_002385 [Friedmanniomyces endolithicus]KAK0849555.1 hypothetical protein LTR03_005192 [Friedmanniomyces endolithicus]
MSSEQTFSTSDLRSTAQDQLRNAAHKHKWAFGNTPTTGKLRPQRPSETSNYNAKRREVKAAVAALQPGAKVARKQDMLEGTAISDESSGSASDYDDVPSPAVDPWFYSFDSPTAPSQGSQILNAALVKAVAKFEERETFKLVKNEYEVLNDEGESVGLTMAGKSKKAKAQPMIVPDADEDYELI